MTGEPSATKVPPNQLPLKHHFSPKFYLSRWVKHRHPYGITVVEFSRPGPDGSLRSAFKVPDATLVLGVNSQEELAEAERLMACRNR